MTKKNTAKPAAPKNVEQGGAQQGSENSTAPTAPSTPPDPQSKVKSKAPASIKLKAPYGFIDDDEKHRYWQPGQVVTDPDDIALLIERKAPVDGGEPAEYTKTEE